ncbi:flagellin N-terminal helical domain-containing protein [Acidimangrovimonas pyrenivorans]|uniref:Flagellin n=1 Tax=Acidimangrovimonas pyrenivorans TaxID=2030798 RepID=A0ABV7ANJ2_9RHOB
MSSILTNTSAMTALQTLKSVNMGLNETQNRISTGLRIQSGADNAAYFAISQTMKGDSGMYKSIDESLTMTKNSVSTAALGASTVNDLAQQFVERVAFAQGDAVDRSQVQNELNSLVDRIGTTIDQASFNGNDLVSGGGSVTVVTGIKRAAGGSFSTTSISFQKVDLTAIKTTLAGIDVSSASTGALAGLLSTAQGALADAVSASTSLGVTEAALQTQQDFLGKLTDKLDTGVGNMVDANMEDEAAKMQAYQVQQQLATQSLSIANKAPQNLLSLFR